MLHQCAIMSEYAVAGHESHEPVDVGAHVAISTDHVEPHDVFGLESLRESSVAHAMEGRHEYEHEREHDDGATSYDDNVYQYQDAWGPNGPQTQVISRITRKG